MGKLWQGSQSNDIIDLRPSEHHKFNVVWAKSGNDVVHGRDISSLDTNETISGANGNDTLYGYWGNDFLSGEGDSDTIYGGFGNDIIRGGYHDWVPGGRLDLGDHLYGEQGDDTILGGEASDRIWGGTGNDRMFGEAGGDHIRGEDGDDYIDVGVGLDVVSGWSGLDVAWGGEGNDTILGGGSGFKTAGQSLLGDNGNDFIRAGASIDYVDGGAGNDTLFGGYSEHIAGSTDFDKIHGGSGDDIIHGDDFFDLVRGGFPGLYANEIQALGGNDVIKVDANQRVFAGVGDDEIYAGISLGGNTLSGGTGKDQFWFYDDHAAEIIDIFKETTKLANLSSVEANEQGNSVIKMYGDLFNEGTVNVIVDFDVEEDVIGFADFLVPVGINDVKLRQEGNDSIISLFERDIILLQGIQTESLSPESFVFDNSLFENVMSNDSVIDEQDEQDEQDDLTDAIGDYSLKDFGGPGFPNSTAPISAEELLGGRKIISLQSDHQFLSPLDDGATTMGTDDDELIIANGNKQVFAGAGNDKIYASISSGSNILTGGDGKDEFWFYDDNDGELGINIVENVVTGEGGFDFDVIENYVRSFQDGTVNTITDFNPEEDVIGVVDFPFPLGLNSFESRQEGNDFIISLFERDIILLQNIQEEDLNTENFIFDNSLFEQILANNLNANNFNANNFNNNSNEPVIVDVSSADNLFPEDVIITSPQPDTSTLFIAGNQNHTFESTIAPDFFNLTSGGANIIQGILAQLNEDIIDGFGKNDQITIQNSLLSAEQIKVSFAFGFTIFLEIDGDGDDNIDSSMTIEGDFTDALFLVNPRENNTDITLKVLDTPIHRFQNKDVPGAYLFAGEEESQSIRDSHSNFVEEGLAFKVAHQGDSLIRINRFQNKDIPGAYLFASEEESKSIRDNHTNFIEEGIAFYAASAGSSTGSGIYRFQSLVNPGTYIFVGEQERQNIIQTYSDVFVEEGIAFEVVG